MSQRSLFARAAKGSHNATPLQQALRRRDRVWGSDYVDVMVRVAEALVKDPDADLAPIVATVRERRRDAVLREGRELAKIADGVEDWMLQTGGRRAIAGATRRVDR